MGGGLHVINEDRVKKRFAQHIICLYYLLWYSDYYYTYAHHYILSFYILINRKYKIISAFDPIFIDINFYACMFMYIYLQNDVIYIFYIILLNFTIIIQVQNPIQCYKLIFHEYTNRIECPNQQMGGPCILFHPISLMKPHDWKCCHVVVWEAGTHWEILSKSYFEIFDNYNIG